MNTLIDFFKDSFVLKVFAGIVGLILSANVETAEKVETTKKVEVTPVEIAFQKKFMEVDNAYFNAAIRTIK